MTFFSHGNLNPKNRIFEFVLQLAKKLQHVSTCTCLQIIMIFFLFFLRKSSDDQDNLERYMEPLPHVKHRFHLQKATSDDDGRQFFIPVFYYYRYNIDIFPVLSRVTPTIIYYSRNYPCSNKIVNDNNL